MSTGTPQKRTGVWFAVAVAAVLALWFGGNELYTRLVILRRQLPRLEPGEVSLIGLKVPGYHIVVSNGVARLSVGDPSTFGKPETSPDASSGTTIPMKGLIGTLRFDEEDAAELVTALNGIRYDILPLEDRIWTKDRIDKALVDAGPERQELEYELATALDGGGIERLNWDRLTTGIWLEVPVTLAVPAAGGTREVVAKVLIPYKTRLATAAYRHFQTLLERGGLGDDLTPTPGTITGVYNRALDDSERGREDVAEALRSRFSNEATAKLAEPVLKVLNEVEVLVTEQTISDANLKAVPREDGTGDMYSITLETTGDSRDRLWQYTYRRPGAQLLLVSDGVAIAAPVVRQQIKYSTVEITGISEKKLAEEALRFIEAASNKHL
jgi:hypothetical protein